MALLAVATSGSVTATAGTIPPPNLVGDWSAGDLVESAYAHFTVAGVAVIWQVECEFTFTGKNANTGVDVPPVKTTLTLTAPATVLQHGSTNVLRKGDTFADPFLNTLAAATSANLASE